MFFIVEESFSQRSAISSADRRSAGGGCEGCDLMYVDIPSKIKSSTVLVKEDEPGEKLELSGIVYKSDGQTPDHNVILYVYQTANSGLTSQEKIKQAA